MIAFIEFGELPAATAAFEEACSLIPTPAPADEWLFTLGRAQLDWASGSYRSAREFAVQGVRKARAMRDQLSTLRSLIWLAQALADDGAAAQATHVLAVASHNQTEQAYRLYRANELRVEQISRSIVERLGDQRLRAEFITASTKSLEEVLASVS